MMTHTEPCLKRPAHAVIGEDPAIMADRNEVNFDLYCITRHCYPLYRFCYPIVLPHQTDCHPLPHSYCDGGELVMV